MLKKNNYHVKVFNKGFMQVEKGMNDLQKQVSLLQEEVLSLRNKREIDKAYIRKYQSIYNHAYNAFFLNEINSDGPGRFIEVNDKAIALFGYNCDEFINKSFIDLIDEDTISKVNETWQNIKEEQNYLFESKSKTKDNKIIFIQLNVVIIEINEQKVLLSSVRDITTNKIAENELLIAKERAEESDKLKSAFLSNISHEIRTPMNAISGFSNLLIQDDLDAATRIEYVNIINTNTNLLLRLITDIVDVSKIESGTLKIIRKKVNINRLFSNLYDVFKSELRRLNKSHIKLIYTKSLVDDDAYLITDPVRLSQILNNLIFNSVKFTDKGFVEYGYELEDNMNLKLYVKDSGIGIVKDKQDVIFEHFRQENDEITQKNHGGTGLGLSISKKLVELLGGKIWVESVTNVGSTFYFTHPYYKPLNSVDKNTSDLRFDWSGKTILLVEDAEVTIDLLSIVLFETNISILIARTTEEAIHLCSSNPSIDLVILDIELPGTSIMDATVSLRHIRPNLNVIGHSNKNASYNTKMLQDVGIMHSLEQPIERENLFNTLKIYLEKN